MDVVDTAARRRNPPRGRAARIAITLGLWLAAVGGGPLVVEYAVVDPLLQLVSDDPLVVERVQLVVAVILLLGQLAVFAWLCPKVSYRWFDCLMLAIPIVGQLFWAPRILWRIAYLPYRDWRPRPDEADSWTRVADPSRPGQLPIYVAQTPVP